MVENCVFCQIHIGQIKSDVLYRDENCFVIRDIVPKASVHLLVIPNRHLECLADFTSEYYSVFGNMFQVVRDMAEKEGVSKSGYRLVINQGTHAGQIVDHIHLHILGGNLLGSMI